MHLFIALLAAIAEPVPLDLPGWVALALDNSPSVQQAEADRAQADAAYGTARSSLLPQVSFTASAGHSWASSREGDEVVDFDEASYSAGISFSQELLSPGGSSWLSLRSASLGRDQAEAGYSTALLSLEQDVACAWYAAVEASWLVASSEDALARSSALLARSQMLFGMGAENTLDLLEARVQATGDSLSLMENSLRLANSLVDLRRIAGLPADTALSVDTSAVLTPLDRQAALSLPVFDGSTPSIEEAELSAQKARLSLGSARRSRLPSLSAGGSWGWSGNEADFTDVPSEDSWSVRLTLDLPIFDGWLTSSRIQSAGASLLSAEASLDAALGQTEAAAATSRNDLLSSIDGIALAELRLEYAGQKMELSRMSFSLGELDLSDLLDAQSAVSAAEADLISARTGCLVAEVDYLVLLGLEPRFGD